MADEIQTGRHPNRGQTIRPSRRNRDDLPTAATQQWKPKRPGRRHDCEDFTPHHSEGAERDLWVCPICRRRWRLTMKGDNCGVHSEGVSIHGPDGSTYWRPYRARFIGRLGA